MLQITIPKTDNLPLFETIFSYKKRYLRKNPLIPPPCGRFCPEIPFRFRSFLRNIFRYLYTRRNSPGKYFLHLCNKFKTSGRISAPDVFRYFFLAFFRFRTALMISHTTSITTAGIRENNASKPHGFPPTHAAPNFVSRTSGTRTIVISAKPKKA